MLKKTPLKKKYSILKKVPLKKGSVLKRSYSPIKKCNKSEEQLEKDKLLREKRTAFYEQCKVEIGLRSAISGRRLSGERINYHHVKAKKMYPEVEFSFNIILPVTMEEHTLLEGNPEYFIENLEKMKFANENWEQLKKESLEWEKQFEKQKERL